MATRSPSRGSNTPVLLHYSTAHKPRSETSLRKHTPLGHDNISMKNEWWESTYRYVTFIKTDYYQPNLEKTIPKKYVNVALFQVSPFQIHVGFHFLYQSINQAIQIFLKIRDLSPCLAVSRILSLNNWKTNVFPHIIFLKTPIMLPAGPDLKNKQILLKVLRRMQICKSETSGWLHLLRKIKWCTAERFRAATQWTLCSSCVFDIHAHAAACTVSFTLCLQRRLDNFHKLSGTIV